MPRETTKDKEGPTSPAGPSPAKRPAQKQTPDHAEQAAQKPDVPMTFVQALNLGTPAKAMVEEEWQEVTYNRPKNKNKGKAKSAKNNKGKGGAPPPEKKGKDITAFNAPRKKKVKPNKTAEKTEFLEKLLADDLELKQKVSAQMEQDDKEQYTVEVVFTPNPKWIIGSTMATPDLTDMHTERDLITLLTIAAGTDGEETFKLDPVKQVKVEGLLRKRCYYQLVCTSKAALEAIVTSDQCTSFRGYSIDYFQPESSNFGFRFQIPLKGLPSPFKDYDILMWLQVLLSQGWDSASMTHIQFATRYVPGCMRIATSMLDVYIKPEAVSNHGCDGALQCAGTHNEALGKKIDYPPASVILGRNPTEEIKEMMDVGYFKGQYYHETPNTRPMGPYNQMMESESGTYLPAEHFGKTFQKNVIKIGACRYCWGPKHMEGELCLYVEYCRECLATLKVLPYKGFHHSCTSLIQSMPKPLRESVTDRKRQRDQFDPGTPADPDYAAYIPSAARGAAQQMRQLMLEKQIKRKRDEQTEAEAAAAASADQVEQMQLSEEEIEQQNEELTKEL